MDKDQKVDTPCIADPEDWILVNEQEEQTPSIPEDLSSSFIGSFIDLKEEQPVEPPESLKERNVVVEADVKEKADVKERKHVRKSQQEKKIVEVRDVEGGDGEVHEKKEVQKEGKEVHDKEVKEVHGKEVKEVKEVEKVEKVKEVEKVENEVKEAREEEEVQEVHEEEEVQEDGPDLDPREEELVKEVLKEISDVGGKKKSYAEVLREANQSKPQWVSVTSKARKQRKKAAFPKPATQSQTPTKTAIPLTKTAIPVKTAIPIPPTKPANQTAKKIAPTKRTDSCALQIQDTTTKHQPRQAKLAC